MLSFRYTKDDAVLGREDGVVISGLKLDFRGDAKSNMGRVFEAVGIEGSAIDGAGLSGRFEYRWFDA